MSDTFQAYNTGCQVKMCGISLKMFNKRKKPSNNNNNVKIVFASVD